MVQEGNGFSLLHLFHSSLSYAHKSSPSLGQKIARAKSVQKRNASTSLVSMLNNLSSAVDLQYYKQNSATEHYHKALPRRCSPGGLFRSINPLVARQRLKTKLPTTMPTSEINPHGPKLNPRLC
ncbi:unnamed protein product [Cuscuta europaea]|uniref:Uncharacterized protein n=1 Tax=Cuscuta europaea TaxID=41803 RepID=A0A9P1EBG4_CUSEU|nr:unnamed protein product [Cuscuta europaea]